MKIDKICRACLQEDEKMIDMSEKDVYQKFLLFANLTADEIPNVPLNLCRSCEQKLNTSLDFKEECQKSHEILLNYVNNTRAIDLDGVSAADADAKKPSRIEPISQSQVLEAIKDLKQNFYENKNCIRCNYVASNSRALSMHISKVHEDLKLRYCCACNEEFDDLSNHVATIHSHDYTCKFCSAKFESINYLTEHLRSHFDEDLLRCSFCKKSFSKQCHLTAHLTKHTNEKPYKCSLCDNSYTQLNQLKDHLNTHEKQDDADKQSTAVKLKDNLQVFKCRYCERKFKTHKTLVQHEPIHNGQRPHICQVCGKSFTKVASLKSHMMVHNIGNKISCKLCDKKFCRQSQLIFHLQRHTGEKQHVCTECGKGFIQRSHLIDHMKIHSGLRPYQCSYCNKSFRQKKDIKRHMWIHSGEKPYKCNQCSYACRHSLSLTNHMKKHMVDKPRADRPHVCLMCNSTFTTDAMLTSHINSHNVSFLEI